MTKSKYVSTLVEARNEAKRQGLVGPEFSRYLDERAAIWFKQTFETEE